MEKKIKYIVLCRPTSNSESKDVKADYYHLKMSNSEYESFIHNIEKKKFIEINKIVINTSEILRVIPLDVDIHNLKRV